MIKCEYCNREFSAIKQLCGHLGHCKERRAKLNLPERVPWQKGKTKDTCEKLQEISERMKGRKITWGHKVSESRKRKAKEGTLTVWNKGLTKEVCEKLKLFGHKLSAIKSSKEFNDKRNKWLEEIGEEGRKKRWATYGNAGHRQSEESIRKNKESNSITLANKILKGELRQNGWAKHGYFEFKNNGRQYYDSTYELERMIWLDKNGYIFKKNPFKIPYFYKGVWHNYIPDLLITDIENANIWLEEIKSSYTLNKDIDKNTAKFNAAKEYCLKNGLEFHVYNTDEYKILDNIEFDEIESIEEIGEDDFYGFCSPIHKNIIIDDVIHHNSGKDTISVLATLYTVYVLLCCKDPLSLFKGVNSDFIDILNVAYNARQAKDVFFAKLVKSVKEWEWLRGKYPYIDSGKSKKEKKVYKTDEVVNLKMDSIIFPKSIRAFAKNSQQNAAEGTNLLVWIADEFSAFSDKNNKSNATEMFDTLRTSSSTRFQNYGKGFVISFTRYKNDPILKLIKQYENDINVYTDIASTFEVRPKETFVGDWGEWNGIEMPVSFIQDFKNNPEGSKAKYLCQPPDSADPWITESHFIDDSTSTRTSMFDFSEFIKDTLHGKMICKKIERQNYNIADKGFIIAGDLGTTNDRTVLTMWHDETSYLANDKIIKHYVQDFILSWIPDKAKNKKVDINNVENIVKRLIFDYHIPVNGIYFDHWNSAQLLDELANKGIQAQAYTLKLEDFTAFRVLLYSNVLSFIKNDYQTEEMKRLTYGKNGKPDHIDGEHDDHFRVNCLAVTALEGFKGNAVVVNEEGTFFKGTKNFKNLNGAFGGLSFKGNFHNGDSDMFDMEQGEF